MDFTKAVSIIGRDLEEAMAMLDQLSEVPGSHIAETELAKSRIRSASDMLKLLPGLYGAGEALTAARPVESGESARLTVGTVEKRVADNETVSAGPAAEVVNAEKEAAVSDVSPEKAEDETVKSPAAPGAKSQESARAILADRFGVKGTLGEKMSSSRKDEVVTSVMQSKPIADIAAAIGINDKFYYIRELFSGDAVAYSDAVSRLNSAASLGEAMKILDESTVMGSDPAAQSSFVDVVRRKFSLNV